MSWSFLRFLDHFSDADRFVPGERSALKQGHHDTCSRTIEDCVDDAAENLTLCFLPRDGRRVALCQTPRLAIFVVQELVRRIAIGEALDVRIPGRGAGQWPARCWPGGESGRTMPFLDFGIGAFPALDTVKEVAGRLLVEIAIGRLDDLALAPWPGILERTTALRHDLVPIGSGINRADCPAKLDFGARPTTGWPFAS